MHDCWMSFVNRRPVIPGPGMGLLTHICGQKHLKLFGTSTPAAEEQGRILDLPRDNVFCRADAEHKLMGEMVLYG